MFQGCNLTTQRAHTGVQGWQTSPCLHHPNVARTRNQSKEADKRACVPGIFSESGMQVFDLLHKPTKLPRYKHSAYAKADDYFCCIFLNAFWGLCETQGENSCSLQSTYAPYTCKIYICNFIPYVTRLGWVDLSWMPGEHHCLFSWARKSIKKGPQDKIRTGKDHSADIIMGRTDSTWGN